MIKTKGIVFRAIKYGESSIIADIFTEEKGLHSFIANGVRAAKSRMPASLFQPMTRIDVVSYFREDTSSALHRIREARATAVYSTIPFDIRRGAVAMFMAEICRKTIHEAEENRPLFRFLEENLEALDRSDIPGANLHLHFLVHLSAFLGFQPETDGTDPQVPQFFDLREGLFSNLPPSHPQYLEPFDADLLIQLLETPLAQNHQLDISRLQRKNLLHQLLVFYELHMPGFGNINSPEIFELLFA